jgi:putative spermidine/putrescine transport system permease protein
MVAPVPPAVRAAATLLAALFAVFMLAPLAVVVLASLSASEFLVFPPRGWSLKWYSEILGSGEYLEAARTSLVLALAATAVALAIGVPAAVALARFRLPGAAALQALFLGPLVLPTIILAIGLLMVVSRQLGGASFWALAVGHGVVTMPYVVRTVAAVLATADPRLEEAARTMGAGFWATLALVTLPQARAGIAAGAFLAFNVSFDEAVLALFLRTPELVTLPVVIYSKLEFSPDPSVAALATLMIAVTALLVVLTERAIGLGRLAA